MPQFKQVLCVALALMFFAVSGTGPGLAGKNGAVGDAIEAFITSGTTTLGKSKSDKELFQIFTFYQDRNFKPIWTRDNGAKGKARALLRALKNSHEHGLSPTFYDVKDIEERIKSKNPEILAELDLLLSKAMVDFGRDLSKGRIVPSRIDRELAITPIAPGPLYLIDGAESADDIEPYLDRLVASTPRYNRLKKALARYRKIAADGGWPKIPSAKKSLKPGGDDARVPLLKKLLFITGDLKANSAPDATVYDDDLVAAVKNFQERHGKTADGVIGPSTLKQLNIPVERRIRKMVLNLERRRWMPVSMGQRFVFVNLADQFLKVVKVVNGREKTIHTARLVVGKPYHRTPVFSDKMRYLVINPYWNVPPSIANKEYLPKLRRDPGYLARQNIRILNASGTEVSPYSVNWSAISRMPFRLRQDTGKRNALGRIKFIFPNKFNVYIHDTPSKSLFKRDTRYFSHGCMRVQNPVDLAREILQAQGWSKKRILAQIASGKRRIISLKTKLPVHITYLTSWVNKDGSVNFRDDVYGRDKRLAAVLIPRNK